MKTLFSRFIFTAGVATALMFFGCNSGVGGNDPSSSSLGAVSSSSLEVVSSSSGGIGGGSSSSSDGGGTNGSVIVTYIYDIVQEDDNALHLVRDGAENCQEDGTVKREKDYILDLSYLLSDNALSLSWNEGWEEDVPIMFSGTSNQLNGTWTRAKDREVSCRLRQGIDDSWIRCDDGYDIIKAVFTQSTATFMHDVCLTDDGNTSPPTGWTSRVVDCNSVEYSKGSDKVTVKLTNTSGHDYMDGVFGYVYTFGDKVCEYAFDLSTAEKEQACVNAITQSKESADEDWRQVLQDFYRANIYNYDEFIHCLEDKGFPGEFWDYYYDTPDYSKALLKKRGSKCLK